MQFKKIYLLCYCCVLNIPVFAQQNISAPAENDCGPLECNDPIAAMLDSLVTINHVVRFNYINAEEQNNKDKFSPFAVPAFSTETYRERMAKLISPIPLVYNQQVRNYIDLYSVKKRTLTSRVLGLSNFYFPMVEEILDREKLPLEFKYLAVVESALNPIAVSRMGATGMWQFMLNTGRLYNLKVNSYVDERRDPVKATEAACQYFKDMYGIYNDWLLVIAAYNCGAGNVNRAITRSGGKTNFWEISRFLPKETRGYVPAFIAVCYVMNYAKEHNLFPVSPAFSYFEVDTVRINKPATIQNIAKAIDVPEDVLSYLNPMIKRNYIPVNEEPYTLRLPANKIAAFVANENSILIDLPSPPSIFAFLNAANSKAVLDSSLAPGEIVFKQIKQTHTVRRGETLNDLADFYRCKTAEIKKWNNLKYAKLYAGQKLRIYALVKYKEGPPALTTEKKVVEQNDSGVFDSSELKVENSPGTKTTTVDNKDADGKNNLRFIYHFVQKGDTLFSIAQRYDGATVQQIKEFNKIKSSNDLRPGKTIKVLIAG